MERNQHGGGKHQKQNVEKRVWFLTIIQAEREETTTKRATEVRVTRAVIARLSKN